MFFRIDTDALDALDPVEAYTAATQIPNQAKTAAAAYADAVAARLAAEHGHRGAARLLSISQPTLSARVDRHLSRISLTGEHITALVQEALTSRQQIEDPDRVSHTSVEGYAPALVHDPSLEDEFGDGQNLTILPEVVATARGARVLVTAEQLEDWYGDDLDTLTPEAAARFAAEWVSDNR